MNNNQKGHKLAKTATVVVATCAALITAVATQGVLVATKAIEYPLLAWAGTFLFEGASICVGYFVWLKGKAGKKAWFERIWFGIFLLIAVFVNGYHSYLIEGNRVGIALAAFIPVVFIVTVETLIKNQDREYEPEKKPRARATRKPVEKARPVASAVGVPAVAVAQEPKQVGHRGQRANANAEAVDRLLAENPGIVGREVAEVLGVSDQHGRKLLAAAKRRAEESPVDTAQRS